MPMKNLQDGLYKEIRELYSAEKQITKALNKMAKKASNEELRSAFQHHRKETERQVERLEQVFGELDRKPRAERNQAMSALIDMTDELLKADVEPEVLDAMLIAAAQKVEHFEIAAYGTARTWASTLGLDQAATLLDETLAEEKKTDDLLNKLAETINPMAVPAAH